MSSSASNPERSLSADQLLELCSGHLDGALSTDELELLRREGSHSESMFQFRAEARCMGELLRSIPLVPVDRSLATAVNAAVRQLVSEHPELCHRVAAASVSDPGSVTLVSRTTSAEPTNRRQRLSRLVVLVAVMAVVLVAVGPELMTRSTQPGFPIASRHSIGERGIGERGSSVPADHVAVQTSGDAPASDQITMDDTAAVAESIKSARSRISHSEHWDVVVVRLSTSDRDAAIRELSAAAAGAGLQIEPMAAGMADTSDSVGVFLTSAESGTQAFLNQYRGKTLAAANDSGSADRLQREQLIAAIRDSMRTPTQSELHFGEVFVAIPRITEPHIAVARADGSNEQATTDLSGQPGVPDATPSPAETDSASSEPAPSGTAIALTPTRPEDNPTARTLAPATGDLAPGVRSSTPDTTEHPSPGVDARVILVVFELSAVAGETSHPGGSAM